MTASPYRPRSQNTDNLPVRETSSTRAATPLRSLPPTLFKLRNLNAASPPISSASGNGSVSASSGPSFLPPSPPADVAVTSMPEPLPTTRTEQRSVNSQTLVDTPTAVAPQPNGADTATCKSIISRLSSQTLVLSIILVIAIAGIVVGNRGVTPDDSIVASQHSHPVTSSTKPSANEGLVESQIPDQSERPTNGGELAKASSSDAVVQPNPVAQTTSQGNENAAPTSSATTAQVDRELTSVAASQASLGAPTVTVNKSPTSDSAPEFTVDRQLPAASVSNIASNVTQRLETQTPSGIDDWTRYLPPLAPTTVQAGTVAAISSTPASPIASYQQYLDSMSSGNPATTAPVGYVADPNEYYGASSLGNQATLPVSSSTSQQR